MATQFPKAFRRVFYKLVPSWLSSGEGELVLYSPGVLTDAFVERARQGLLARWPSHAPSDALPYLGRDRQIVRGINEPEESYRARLIPWLDQHIVRGNPWALMEQLAAYCQAAVRIRMVDARGNWYTRERDGTESYSLDTGTWNWDNVPAAPHWSRFWVIIYPTLDGEPWEQRTGETIADWGTDADPHSTYGSTMTTGEAATIRAIIRSWQPDGTRGEWVIVAFDDASFDPLTPEPDGTWGRFGKPSGVTTVPSRLDTAAYFAGVDGGPRGNSP
jgi:hypothetical protein